MRLLCFQTSMNVRAAAILALCLKAASTSREDTAACPSHALQTSGRPRRGKSWLMTISWWNKRVELSLGRAWCAVVVCDQTPLTSLISLFSWDVSACWWSRQTLFPFFIPLFPPERSSAFHFSEHFHFFPFSRCERVTCEFTQDPASCFALPLRISFYNISFPANTPVPTDVFRMGPSNSVPGDKMILSIVSGDEEGYFMVKQQSHGGEISLRRALSQPRDFFLTVEMRLIRYGTAHLYMAKIAVFVTAEQSIRPSRIYPY